MVSTSKAHISQPLHKLCVHNHCVLWDFTACCIEMLRINGDASYMYVVTYSEMYTTERSEFTFTKLAITLEALCAVTIVASVCISALGIRWAVMSAHGTFINIWHRCVCVCSCIASYMHMAECYHHKNTILTKQVFHTIFNQTEGIGAIIIVFFTILQFEPQIKWSISWNSNCFLWNGLWCCRSGNTGNTPCNNYIIT